MKPILFLPGCREDRARFSDMIAGDPVVVTMAGPRQAVKALLALPSYGAVVISETVCRGKGRSYALEVARLAERLRIPALLFPGRNGAFEELERLIPLPTTSPLRRGGDRSRVEGLIDDLIRPVLQVEGSDVEFVDFIGDRVVLRFLGICSACPAERVRNRREIERFLWSELPDLKFVVVEENGFPPGRWW